MTKELFLDNRLYLKKFCEEYNFCIDGGEYDKIMEAEHSINELKKKKNQNVVIKEEILTYETRIKGFKKQLEYRKNGQFITDDNGSVGISTICNIAKLANNKIFISGSGADEIFSDYGYGGKKIFGHSTIGGLFPEDLKTVFPWKNFYKNTQRAYLIKDEYVTGSYGIEGRFPFLDKMVVQEFLWLSHELKNSNYKAPLHYYLKKNNYPFIEKEKIGFNCGFNNIRENYSIKK